MGSGQGLEVGDGDEFVVFEKIVALLESDIAPNSDDFINILGFVAFYLSAMGVRATIVLKFRFLSLFIRVAIA